MESFAISWQNSSVITRGSKEPRRTRSWGTAWHTAVIKVSSLGFSGSAKGEPAMAEAIAELDLAAFVYDYDYNAPNPEHLAKTHEKFFQIIRAKHPDLPVVILSKINGPTSRDTIKRRDIIRKTYENAVAKGDKNVYFLDGCKFFGDVDRYECTVDGTHPNDLGFYRMYQGVLPTLQKILNK